MICRVLLLQPNGYEFNIKGVKQVLRGALVAFLGDTPAVSKVAGFKEGVGFAQQKCRHCMANDLQIQENVRSRKINTT